MFTGPGNPTTGTDDAEWRPAAGETAFRLEQLQDLHPLDAQIGHWPKQTAPALLQALLFPPISPPALAGTTKPATFAILDAAKLPFLPQRLDGSGLQHCSLFDGETAEDLRDVAPYLVELEPENDFTRRIFTASGQPGDLAMQEPGLICRAPAALDQMRRHFRRFTRVQNDQGDWIYFRYWERSLFLALRASLSLPASQRFFAAASLWVFPSFPQRRAWLVHHAGAA